MLCLVCLRAVLSATGRFPKLIHNSPVVVHAASSSSLRLLLTTLPVSAIQQCLHNCGFEMCGFGFEVANQLRYGLWRATVALATTCKQTFKVVGKTTACQSEGASAQC